MKETNTPTKASLWRRELAAELVAPYASRPGIEMVLLGGSPARGLSDEYSDLDVVLYWDKLDAEFVRSHPLSSHGTELITVLDMPEDGSILEIYTLGGLIVEFGHGTVASLKKEIDDVTVKHTAHPALINTIGGFRDALPLHGKAAYAKIVAAMPPYPDELAKKVVQQNLGFFWKGCLMNQGHNRGETLFVYDGMCAMLKRLLAILAALNRVYWWPGEPRWIGYWSSRMKVCPRGLWPRIKRMMEGDRAEALADLYILIDEVLALVRRHMPDVDMDRVTRFEKLEVRGTKRRPARAKR